MRLWADLRAVATFFLGVLVLAGCSEREEPQRVRLWALAPPEVTPVEGGDQLSLRFAVALTISPQEGYQLYGDLTEALGRRIGRPVHLILRRSFAETNDLMRSRGADAAQLCSRGFFQGRADFGLIALAVPVMNGRKTSSSYVIVQAASEIDTPGELTGRTFAFADPVCAPEPYPAGQKGWGPDGFFKRKLLITSHDRAVRAVAEGLVEGALVDGSVYARLGLASPAESAKTRVIAATAPYLNSPIVVHPALDPQLREDLRRAFLSLHEEGKGRAVLTRLGIERFVAPPEGGGGRSGASGRAGR